MKRRLEGSLEKQRKMPDPSAEELAKLTAEIEQARREAEERLRQGPDYKKILDGIVTRFNDSK